MENAILNDGGLPPAMAAMEEDMDELNHIVLTRLQDCGLFRTLETNDNWILIFPHSIVTDISLKVIEKDGVKVIWTTPPPTDEMFQEALETMGLQSVLEIGVVVEQSSTVFIAAPAPLKTDHALVKTMNVPQSDRPKYIFISIPFAKEEPDECVLNISALG